MKVLVAHNEYSAAVPSGENVAVRRQLVDLERAGMQVVPYLRSSDEIGGSGGPGRLRAAASALGASDARRDLVRLLHDERPDILHLHNPFPLLSARVIDFAHSHGVPVVQTVHNFRHECISGNFFRDGHDCADCVGRATSYPGVQHACYRESRSQSAVMTLAQVAHRPAFRRLDGVIALTPELVGHLLGYGITADRISVVPNTVPDPGPPAGSGSGVLFAGRFSQEKGLALLAAAWSDLPEHSAGMLTIAGDGPERALAVDLAARRGDVRYVGAMPAERVGGLLQATAVVVVPSRWREVCPLIVLEALAHGRPVLATNCGGLPYLVGSDGGWVVEDTRDALHTGLLAALGADAAAASEAARARYLREFAPAAVTGQLVAAYEQVLRRTRRQ